jgi:Icc-related predicted phosphoesterase
MRLQILSDLHLGGHRDPATFSPPDVEADVLLLAGDIQRGTAGLVWAARVGRAVGKQVVYVPGNHEHYQADMLEMLAQLRKEAQRLGIYLLDNDHAIIDGVRFLGSTLWTDFALYPELKAASMRAAGAMINDFRLISYDRIDFTPAKSVELHRFARAWLAEQLATSFAGPTVVVTHHAPHAGSVVERFRGDVLTPGFASDLGGLIEHCSPELWVHGHMHDCSDYRVGKTRIVCNPMGYAGEINTFDPGLVIDI